MTISELEENDILWSGKPFPGLFVRSYQYFGICISVVAVFGLTLLALLSGRSILTPILIAVFIVLIWGVGLLRDQNLRGKLRYELRHEGLKIFQQCADGSETELRFIPMSLLTNIKPDWPGKVASISLPPGIKEAVYQTSDGWERVIPAHRPTMRLELIAGADDIASMIRQIAQREQKRPKE